MVTLGALCLVVAGPLTTATAQGPSASVQPGAGGSGLGGSGLGSSGLGNTGLVQTPSASGAGTQPDGAKISVLGESAWVSDHQDYQLRLAVNASNPTAEHVDVVIYNRLTTRTGFDEALSGQIHGYAMYTLKLAVAALPADPGGGVDIDIPVNPADGSSSGPIPPFYAVAGSAVFPVQIQLDNGAGVAQGASVNTFLVYGEAPSVSGLPKLAVSLTLPISTAPSVDNRGRIGALPTPESTHLARLVDNLAAHPGIGLTLSITPATLEALRSSSASELDRSTLSTIIGLAHEGNVEVAPSTYANVPLRGWSDAGLGSELRDQLATGSSVLRRVLGAAPSPTTWVINGSIDNATLRILQSSGASQFIVPNAELSALPVVADETTFALPTHLDGAGGRAAVYGADSGLTGDFSNPGGPVLAASQLLAEMAMIQLETPGLTRGVAVLPPPGWTADATFVDTLLAGLEGNPLLDPVTASGLFAAAPVFSLHRSLVVPPPAGAGESTAPSQSGGASQSAGQGTVGSSASSASGTGSNGPAGSGPTGTEAGTPAAGATGSLVPTGPAGTGATASKGAITAAASGVSGDIGSELGPDVSTIMAARRGLAGMVAVLPQEAKRVVTLNEELLTAESADITEAQRQGLLTEVQAAVTKVTSLITLPRSSSITLTSTKGSIPLTVLSRAPVRARVELRLSSERLLFQAFSPPNGSCTVLTSTSEDCTLTLVTQNTTLKVPVEARASGVFPVQVSLWTPDGSELIAQARDTVRSTAVSGVGVILILVAIIALGIWWVRDFRHGRRSRQLVPAPVDDTPDENTGPGPEDEVGNPIPEVDSPVDEAGLPVQANLPDPETMVRQIFSVPVSEYRDQASGTPS